jgi:hypothetical protein
MTELSTFLVLVSAALFAVTAVYDWIRTRRHLLFLFEVAGIVATVLALNVLFNLATPIVSFGTGDRLLIAFSFAAVVSGMGAQYLFEHWNKPRHRRRFDLPSFIKPFLISPIIFLPVLGLIPDDLKELSRRDIFVCLNAFQNGFFWRVIYDKVEHQLRG